MKTQRWIQNSLLLAGMVAIGIWAWSNASGPIFQSWENWVFERRIRAGEPATLTVYLVEKEEQIAGKVRVWLGLPATPKSSVPPIIVPQPVVPRIENNGLVGRLTIPRLNLSAIVREGTDRGTLDVALGHIPSTALPGQKGNVGVAGHRDMLFRGLREIRKNDQILFETLGGNYLYEVESTEIVSPQKVSVLKTGQYSELTLVTCYPFYYVGSAPDRFIVKARQVSQTSSEQKVSEAPQEMVQQTNELAPARPEIAENNAHSGRQVVTPKDLKDRTASAVDRMERKLAVRKVGFQVSKNHSRELARGISLGVTRTDVTYRSVDGWMWVMPDRRTIWLRNQRAHQPVVFYSYQDGKKRELVITNVTRDSVNGYLLVPASGTAERIPAPHAPRVASEN